MPYTDIAGDISVHDFRMAIRAPSLSENKQVINFNITGVADPALTASITAYQYSMDNGTTWEDMTPSSATVLTGLSFTPSGSTLSFGWEAKQDIGTLMYNNTIRTRFRATSGSLVTGYAAYTVYFERLSSNLAEEANKEIFPSDYSGLSGKDLLSGAPRTEI